MSTPPTDRVLRSAVQSPTPSNTNGIPMASPLTPLRLLPERNLVARKINNVVVRHAKRLHEITASRAVATGIIIAALNFAAAKLAEGEKKDVIAAVNLLLENEEDSDRPRVVDPPHERMSFEEAMSKTVTPGLEEAGQSLTLGAIEALTTAVQSLTSAIEVNTAIQETNQIEQ